MTENSLLKDKRILITGGTTGIGRATAIRLATLGAKVIILGRHEDELNDALASVSATGGEVLGVGADIATEDGVKKVFAEVDKHFGGLDMLVNNAGLGYKSILDGTYSEWEYVLKVNLLGYLAFAHEAGARMSTNKTGHIINIGSLSAEVKDKGSSVYVATKSGVRGFTESLRKEMNELGIKVTLIEPGAVGTDMQPETPDEQKEKIEKAEMLRAEDIASAIEYILLQPARVEVTTIQLKPHQQLI